MKKLSFVLLALCTFPPILAPAVVARAEEGSSPPVISWQDAGKHMGQEVYVTGKVVRIGSGRTGQVFLNFAQNYRGTLSIYLPKEAAAKLTGDAKTLYQGKTVKIRGKIIEHQGSPSLTVSDPAAIEMVTDGTSGATEAEPAAVTPDASRTEKEEDEPPAPAASADTGSGLRIAWNDAADFVGHRVSVVGKVVRTFKSGKGNVLLNFKQDYQGSLTLFISTQVAAKFKDDPSEFYKNKMVEARGQITLFKGSPSLTITGPDAIKVLPDDTPLPERPTEIPPLPAGGAGDGSLPAIKPEEYIPTIPWTAAESFMGQEVFLIGQVLRATSIPNGPGFLNFTKDQDSLSIFIRENYKANFPDRVDLMYKDKMIKVRGRLYSYKNKPSISVSNPAQITILPDDAKVPTQPIVPVTVAPTMTAKPGPTITVASYNVLNLFDDVDDAYRGDDAADAKPRSEINAIAASIRKLDADVIALVEVENRDILRVFLRALLPDMGYEAVLVEGNDDRGIDVAVLSRFPVGEVTSHQHERFPDGSGDITRFRRDLLRVRINPPGGTPFDIFAVHFKSKGGEETGGIDARVGEARKAREVLDGILEKEPNAQFVICGDFNDEITSEPLKALLGSGPGRLTAFIDDLPADNRITYNQEPYRSMIDFILASPAMAKRYVKNSYTIHPGSPETTGSDHNPVLAKFRTK